MSRRPNIPRSTPNPAIARARADASARRAAATPDDASGAATDDAPVEPTHVPAGLDADGATVAETDRSRALRVMRLVFTGATALLVAAGVGLVTLGVVALDSTAGTVAVAAAGTVVAATGATIGVVAAQRIRTFATTGEVPRKPTL